MRKFFLLVPAAFLCGAALRAQDDDFHRHHNISVTIGAQQGNHLNADFTTPSGTTTWNTHTKGRAGMLRELQYGFHFHRNWELTAEWSHFSNKQDYSWKVYDPNFGSTFFQDAGTLDSVTDLYLVGIKMHMKPSKKGSNFYIGAEAGKGDTTSFWYSGYNGYGSYRTASGVSNASGFAWSALLGGEIAANRHFRIRIEAKHAALNASQDPNTVFLGKYDKKPAHNSLGIGLVWSFGK